MPVLAVTVSLPAASATPPPGSSTNSSSPSPGVIAAIVIGSLLGGVLFILLILYLYNRFTRHEFTRVENPTRTDARGTLGLRHLSRNSSQGSHFFTRHSQKPSISSEPLMSPASWPPLPATSRVLSPEAPRLDPILHGVGDPLFHSLDFSTIDRAVASDAVSHPTIPAKRPSPSLRSSLGNTPLHSPHTPHDDMTSPPTPPKTLFLQRMLKSRAQASEGVSLAPSSRSTTLDSSGTDGDEERLLAEAENTALQDASSHREEEVEEDVVDEGVGWKEEESTGSIYSQVSASLDHFGSLTGTPSRQNSSSSVTRRKSYRKRTSAPITELHPVIEMPYASEVLDSQIGSSPKSTMANLSLDAHLSHGTISRPTTPSFTPSVAFPLLTSGNFGKNSTTTGTTAGSKSSCRTSRYPSLTLSSLEHSLGQSPHHELPPSDTGTEWHNPPPGLAGLTSLHIGPLMNPHSPVDERPEQPDVFRIERASTQRARLREGTASSIPEVERRIVMQGGIASIDVAL